MLAEVAFVMTSPRHYAVPRSAAAPASIRLVRWPGLGMPAKSVTLAALRFQEAHPELDFPDALVIAQARFAGARLASFDRDVRRVGGVPLWEPDAGAGG